MVDRGGRRGLIVACVSRKLWEETLALVAKALGIDLGRLPRRKSAADKVRLAAMMRRVSSASNIWLAQRLQMGVPGAVPQYVRLYLSQQYSMERDLDVVLSRFPE